MYFKILNENLSAKPLLETSTKQEKKKNISLVIALVWQIALTLFATWNISVNMGKRSELQKSQRQKPKRTPKTP